MIARWVSGVGGAFGLVALAVSCGSVKPLAFDSPQTYFSTMRTLVVEVIYEFGAEPSSGTLGGVGPLAAVDVWKISEDNLAALFAGRAAPPTLQIEKSSSQWKAIAEQNQAGWTTAELAAVIGANRSGVSTSDTAYFTVAFLKGRYEESGSVNNSVLGVSVGGTPFIAIFKDTIAESSATPTVRKFVEQTTLAHELAHALGLVNNGVPMVVSHQDTAHGAHCSNTACLMYYLNQKKENIETFVQQYLTSGKTVLFDQGCIDDTTAFVPTAR